MKKITLLTLIFLLLSNPTYSQSCPAGIPSGGNPMCIPPDRPESPYYNGSNAYVQQPAQPQTILIKRRWADRWGAIAGDGVAGALGFVTGFANKDLADKAAMKSCVRDGGKRCERLLSFYNQCAAFAIGNNGGYTARAKDAEFASQIALEECKKNDSACQVYKTACSMAEIEKE